VALKGDTQLRARLKAIKQTFKPVGKQWGEDTAKYSRAHVPVKSGATQRSIRVRNASQKRATVVGKYTVNFIDAGTAAHDERPKKRKAMRYGTGEIRFAKRIHHPRVGARPFKKDAAQYGLRKNPMAVELLKLWNNAA
jgi:hypothetical protein